MATTDRPKLRLLDSHWTEQNGQPVLVLRDRLGLSSQVAVVPPVLAFLAFHNLGQAARPVKVQVRVEVVGVKGIDRFSMRRGNVPVSHVLANHRTILCFRQPVIIRPPRT